MIPAGPFLLTSMTLAVSVIRLSKRKTMVQELYCIEMLARVDTICLDKTGTLTDGTMRVVETIDFNSGSRYTLKEIMGSVLKAQNDKNMTSKALKKHFGAKSVLKHTAIVPFSSSRKLSAVSFEKEGTFFLGAPEFVLNSKNQRVDSLVRKYAEKGFRVLLLAQSSSVIYAKKDEEIKLPVVRRPIALIVIEDHIRDDAVKTINWFKENGVGAKIISGDNPLTVSHIAAKVGVENAENYISLEGLDEKTVAEIATKYTVFGRVSPEQKAVLVKAIKKAGHTVAMTGDGVNDILALRESDCAIALAGGSQAACNAAHLVLLDDNFASLPQVVAEGAAGREQHTGGDKHVFYEDYLYDCAEPAYRHSQLRLRAKGGLSVYFFAGHAVGNDYRRAAHNHTRAAKKQRYNTGEVPRKRSQTQFSRVAYVSCSNSFPVRRVFVHAKLGLAVGQHRA